MQTAAVKVAEGGIEGIEFFGAVDKNKDGMIGSDLPAYCFEQSRQDLEDRVGALDRELKSGAVPEKQKPSKLQELAVKKARLDAVDASKPKLSERQMDEMAKIRKSIGAKISSSMYSLSQMEKVAPGANPFEEHKRQTEPCIALDEKEIAMAHRMNCRIVSGRVSRNDATRVWKTCGALLSEYSDPETLRKR